MATAPVVPPRSPSAPPSVGEGDWYRFWLKDEERNEVVIPGETKASLKEQYVRWEEMKELKRLDDAKPRCTAAAAAGGQ